MTNPSRATFLMLAAAGMLPIAHASGDGSEPRVLRKEIVVRAPLADVWHAWTTTEGAAFISAESNVVLEVGGPFEWFLHLEPDERGLSGSQGCRVLAFLPGEMLAFDWTFPPSIPTLRSSGTKTQAVVLFDDLGDGRVRVRFAQHGWGTGEDWDAGWAYFDDAWSAVLERLKASLEAAEKLS